MIKLTQLRKVYPATEFSEFPIWVNEAQILYLQPRVQYNPNETVTSVQFANTDSDYLYVKESCEDIAKLIHTPR